MQRQEIIAESGLIVVLFRSLIQGQHVADLYKLITENYPEGSKQVVLTLNAQNPLDVLLKHYAEFFGRSDFQTLVVSIEKHASKEYSLGGLYLFMGQANVTLKTSSRTEQIAVSFGDLLSIRGGGVTTSVAASQELFTLHFMENANYDRLSLEEDHFSSRMQGDGALDAAGAKTGFWKETSDEFSGEGNYLSGKRTGLWRVGGPNFDYSFMNEQGYYVNGERTGHWVEFEESYKQEGDYLRGKKTGMWITSENGKTLEQGNYLDGKKVGTWIESTDDGVMQSKDYDIVEQQGSLFRAHVQESGLFGGITQEDAFVFNGNVVQQGSPFGAPVQQQETPLFGGQQQGSPFGAPVQQQETPLFGGQQQGSPFGAPVQQQETPLFGGQQQGSPFGAPVQQQESTVPQVQQQETPLFGGQQQGSPFGAPVQQQESTVPQVQQQETPLFGGQQQGSPFGAPVQQETSPFGLAQQSGQINF